MDLNGILRTLNFLLIFCCFLISETSSEKDITITVAQGTEECFYESLKPGYVFNIDYQVIDGQGAFDISFYLMSPEGRAVVMDFKKSEKSHRIEVDEDGDYKLCFDNKFSTFSSKTVFFELVIESEDGVDVDMWDLISGNLPPEDQYDVAIKDIEESVKRVNSHLLKIRHIQETIKAFASKDKNIMEESFFMVNWWSFLIILAVLIVGLIQVVMVKSLFDEHSKMHNVWKNTVR